jgi:hypothetical protein
MKKIIISSAIALMLAINGYSNDIKLTPVKTEMKNTFRLTVTSKDTLETIYLINPEGEVFHTIKVNSNQFDKIISLNVPESDLSGQFTIMVKEKNMETKYFFTPEKVLSK